MGWPPRVLDYQMQIFSDGAWKMKYISADEHEWYSIIKYHQAP